MRTYTTRDLGRLLGTAMLTLIAVALVLGIACRTVGGAGSLLRLLGG